MRPTRPLPTTGLRRLELTTFAGDEQVDGIAYRLRTRFEVDGDADLLETG